jgi:hypothetical protein
MKRDFPEHIQFQRSETEFSLWRLTDGEYQQLRQNSLPIKEDGMFLLRLMLYERSEPEQLTLPKALITLEHLFGHSSDWFDDGN